MIRKDRTKNIGGEVLSLVKKMASLLQSRNSSRPTARYCGSRGTRHLHMAAYYRPKENDADEFRRSLEMVSK